MNQTWQPPYYYTEARDYLPYNKTVAAFNARYPHVVSFYEMFGRGPKRDECEAAFTWLEQSGKDFEITNAAAYFTVKEDAVLFKLGLWIPE